MRQRTAIPPSDARVSVLHHRVPFYETDGMGVVHHANFVRFLELARVQWMDDHHRPYREYVAKGLHFATTRVEIDYRASARFDDVIEIRTWLDRLGGASLRMAYLLRCDDRLLATALTDHALVNLEGRVRRIPPADRDDLRKRAIGKVEDAPS